MKRRLRASKRDMTGLACIVGMGLLVLLAWAALPRSSAEDGLQDLRTDAIDAIDTDNKPAPASPGKDVAEPRH